MAILIEMCFVSAKLRNLKVIIVHYYSTHLTNEPYIWIVWLRAWPQGVSLRCVWTVLDSDREGSEAFLVRYEGIGDGTDGCTVVSIGQAGQAVLGLGELHQRIQPEVEVLRGNACAQILVQLTGELVAALQQGSNNNRTIYSSQEEQSGACKFVYNKSKDLANTNSIQGPFLAWHTRIHFTAKRYTIFKYYNIL